MSKGDSFGFGLVLGIAGTAILLGFLTISTQDNLLKKGSFVRQDTVYYCISKPLAEVINAAHP